MSLTMREGQGKCGWEIVSESECDRSWGQTCRCRTKSTASWQLCQGVLILFWGQWEVHTGCYNWNGLNRGQRGIWEVFAMVLDRMIVSWNMEKVVKMNEGWNWGVFWKFCGLDLLKNFYWREWENQELWLPLTFDAFTYFCSLI